MPSPAYDPLPLTQDQLNTALYEPASHSNLHTPDSELEPLDSSPPTPSRPRFIGAALSDGPHPRDSIASSQNSYPLGGDGYDSSVYGLNPASGSRDPTSYNLGYRDDPHDSEYPFDTAEQPRLGQMSPAMRSSPYLEEKRSPYASSRPRSKRKVYIIASIAALVLLVLAIVIPVYFTVIKPNDTSNNNVSGTLADGAASSASGSGTATATSAKASASAVKTLAVTGGDGSTVTMDDGTTFTYTNPFGGYWYFDENDPFNNGARPQSWSPALNETFNYGVDIIRGVNLGGWLVVEPFIVPSLFEPYANTSSPAVDEWTLTTYLNEQGNISVLEDHYNTFITEKDFAEIAAAGLNYVRIPIAYWAIEVRSGEPFLPKVSWTYFLKAIKWARKYGLRINVDLHSLPGSQNGWNHSGKLGTINFLNGPMGLANAQRALDYIRIIAEFISQPEYRDVVSMFGVTNEPQAPIFGQSNLARYYLQAYNNVRNAGGIGAGNGPWISYHDGFMGLANWAGYFPQSDRTSLDIHQYLCFTTQTTDDYAARRTTPCSAWASAQNTSMSDFGLTLTAEWSNAINDCGLWVNGVGLGARYDGTFDDGNSWPDLGSCTPWTDWQNYNSSRKADIKAFALSSMSAFQNYFFWTWKIGNSTVTGKVEAPVWSYQLGLQEGWMPTDPRAAAGICDNSNPWTGPLESWQTGGASAGDIPATFTSSFTWPPTSITSGGAVSTLPTYTPTGTIVTLPAPTFTGSASANAGSGWENVSDTAGMYVDIATCSYLDPWVGPTASPPSPLCSSASKREDDVPESIITPFPRT